MEGKIEIVDKGHVYTCHSGPKRYALDCPESEPPQKSLLPGVLRKPSRSTPSDQVTFTYGTEVATDSGASGPLYHLVVYEEYPRKCLGWSWKSSTSLVEKCPSFFCLPCLDPRGLVNVSPFSCRHPGDVGLPLRVES